MWEVKNIVMGITVCNGDITNPITKEDLPEHPVIFIVVFHQGFMVLNIPQEIQRNRMKIGLHQLLLPLL